MTIQEWHQQNPDTSGIYPIVEDGEVVGTLDAREGGSDEFEIIDDEYAVSIVVPDARIMALRGEAAEAGDLLMVGVCNRAISGSRQDMVEVARVIRNAEAQS